MPDALTRVGTSELMWRRDYFAQLYTHSVPPPPLDLKCLNLHIINCPSPQPEEHIEIEKRK